MKKSILRYILGSVFVLAFVAGMGMLLHLSRERRQAILCSGLEVKVSGNWQTLSAEDIRKSIDKFYGTYVGVKLSDIQPLKIENMLRAKPAVEDAQVWLDDTGLIHAEVRERTPILRFDYKGKSSFVDRNGIFFPTGELSDSVGVTTILCSPLQAADPVWLSSLLAIVEDIMSSRQWKDKITGYEYNSEDGLILLADSGERLIIGELQDEKEKFSALKSYYSRIAPIHRDDPYKSVNVKYKKQIICRKDL